MVTRHSKAELEKRFWDHVSHCRHGLHCKKCCWEWHGPKVTGGYGEKYIDGMGKRATHIALEIFHGAGFLFEFRRLIFAMHKCDNPPCCNPSHLIWGTAGDNLKDAIAKGRFRGRKKTIVKRHKYSRKPWS